jgi:hypothetical protein
MSVMSMMAGADTVNLLRGKISADCQGQRIVGFTNSTRDGRAKLRRFLAKQ